MHRNNIHIHPDSESLIEAAALHWAKLANAAIDRHTCFHVALSGGSTPAALHRRLAQHDFADKIDWSRTHIWFGDERCVGPEHPDSNYRMARETLLQLTPIPPEQIHRIHGEASQPPQAAQQYATLLEKLLPTRHDLPCFDLMMLGIGADGHIASLFPNSENLKVRHTTVSAAWIDTQKGWRISLTLPVIQNARHIMLLASGKGKADILEKVLGNHPATDALPATLIRGLPQTEWFLDHASTIGLRHL
jgi:6-phosphogluconolactonase